MMLRVLNVLLHGLHLLVIVFCLVGWAFAETRLLHLVLCGLTLASWFLIGPLIGRPGYCFLTGMQHWVWTRLGREERPTYMSYLYHRLTGRDSGATGRRTIEVTTQVVFYGCTLLSVLLF